MAASEIIKHESEAAPPWTLFACDRRLPFGEPAADRVGCGGTWIDATDSRSASRPVAREGWL